MNMMIYIFAAVFIGCFIGFFTASLMASRKIQTLEKESWSAANLYYKRRYKERETAL